MVIRDKLIEVIKSFRIQSKIIKMIKIGPGGAAVMRHATRTLNTVYMANTKQNHFEEIWVQGSSREEIIRLWD